MMVWEKVQKSPHLEVYESTCPECGESATLVPITNDPNITGRIDPENERSAILWHGDRVIRLDLWHSEKVDVEDLVMEAGGRIHDDHR